MKINRWLRHTSCTVVSVLFRAPTADMGEKTFHGDSK
jgi:hypothetical protein